MATALAKEVDLRGRERGVVVSSTAGGNSSNGSSDDLGDDNGEKNTRVKTDEVYEVALPLGAPAEEKRFWFQRGKHYDAAAIATQPSVFDDPDTAKQ
jgi:hypothetical protein